MAVGERKGLKIKNNLKFHILKYIYTYTNPPDSRWKQFLSNTERFRSLAIISIRVYDDESSGL